ncbi:unnamed protein product [Sympodiomycopsis kandeliae]
MDPHSSYASASTSHASAGPQPVGHLQPAPPVQTAQYLSTHAIQRIWHQQQKSRRAAGSGGSGPQSAGSAAAAASGSSGPTNSRLPTLPEASHINALDQATGPSPLGFPSVSDISLDGLSAPQQAVLQAKAAGYTTAVVDLANDEFRQRWEYLCLQSPEDEQTTEPYAAALRDPSASQNRQASSQSQPQPSSTLVPPGWSSTMANPGGMGGSWELLSTSANIPPEAGGRPMIRSSSRNLLQAPDITQAAQARQAFQALAKKQQQAREAEEWRLNPCFRRTELNLTRLDDTDGIAVTAPAWLELDAEDEGIRLDSEIALHSLLTYASFLAVPIFILPPPSSDPSRRHLLPYYARAINAALSHGPGGQRAPSAGSVMKLAVRLPISSPHSLAQILASRSAGSIGKQQQQHPHVNAMQGSSALRASDDWAFEAWSHIRHSCGYNSRLNVVLDLSMPLPASSGLSRWIAEPVSHIWLPANSFLANAKGFPVLSKATQSFLRSQLAKTSKPVIVLSGTSEPPPQHTRGGPQAYLEYVRYLERSLPPESAVDAYARGYADWLQAPLQPLMDNLESGVYEVFERDPVKYALYEEAVYKCLLTRPAGEITNIWVCGAGRGPLVTRCLNAAEEAGRAVKITALEKNASAMIILQEKQVKEWGADRVELRFGDMRTAERPAREEDRADIVVSELLGSFGDNELSPECLDGGCRFLKTTGVSIPQSYTSFITPLSSAKLHNEVLTSGSAPGSSGQTPCASNAGAVKAAETPFVVLFGQVDFPATEGDSAHEKIQECWKFAHGPIEGSEIALDASGVPLSNSHNVRTTSHTFTIGSTSTIHGLAGYFEAHLYADVVMSIHPDPSRGSKDMLSWFPMYFPLKEPLYVPGGSEVDVHLWRLTSDKKVWYEWVIESFLNIPVSTGHRAATTSRPGSSMSNNQETGIPTTGLGLNLSSSSQPPPPSIPQVHFTDSSPTNGHETNSIGIGGGEFLNAMHTPRIPSVKLEEDKRFSQASSQPSSNRMVNRQDMAAVQRVKIGMSSLQNPNGRSHWVGM